MSCARTKAPYRTQTRRSSLGQALVPLVSTSSRFSSAVFIWGSWTWMFSDENSRQELPARQEQHCAQQCSIVNSWYHRSRYDLDKPCHNSQHPEGNDNFQDLKVPQCLQTSRFFSGLMLILMLAKTWTQLSHRMGCGCTDNSVKMVKVHGLDLRGRVDMQMLRMLFLLRYNPCTFTQIPIFPASHENQLSYGKSVPDLSFPASWL